MVSNCLFRLDNAFKQGLQKSILGAESRLGDLVEISVAQQRLWFSNSKFFYSVASAGLTDFHVVVAPATLAAAKANLFVINQRKELFSSWSPFSCICYTISIRACISGLRLSH